MRSLIFSLIAAASLLSGTTTSADTVFLLGGVGTDKQNFASYTEELDAVVVFDSPSANPLTANHTRQLDEYARQVSNLLQNDRVVLMGYSVGGKFAAALAERFPAIDKLVLIDPVDGPPPFSRVSERFPIFADGESKREGLEVFIVDSEFGEDDGLLGASCVTSGLGGNHFNNYFGDLVVSYQTLSGAGHSDLVDPPLSFALRTTCRPRGNFSVNRQNIGFEIKSFIARD